MHDHFLLSRKFLTFSPHWGFGNSLQLFDSNIHLSSSKFPARFKTLLRKLTGPHLEAFYFPLEHLFDVLENCL